MSEDAPAIGKDPMVLSSSSNPTPSIGKDPKVLSSSSNPALTSGKDLEVLSSSFNPALVIGKDLAVLSSSSNPELAIVKDLKVLSSSSNPALVIGKDLAALSSSSNPALVIGKDLAVLSSSSNPALAIGKDPKVLSSSSSPALVIGKDLAVLSSSSNPALAIGKDLAMLSSSSSPALAIGKDLAVLPSSSNPALVIGKDLAVLPSSSNLALAIGKDLTMLSSSSSPALAIGKDPKDLSSSSKPQGPLEGVPADLEGVPANPNPPTTSGDGGNDPKSPTVKPDAPVKPKKKSQRLRRARGFSALDTVLAYTNVDRNQYFLKIDKKIYSRMEEDSGYNLIEENTLDIDSLLWCRLKHQLPTPSTEHYSTWDYTGRLGCIKAFFVGGKYVINVNDKMYSKGYGERKFRLVDSHAFDKKSVIYCWLVHIPSPNGRRNVENHTERPGLVPSRMSNTASPNIENNTEDATSPPQLNTASPPQINTTLPPKINTEDILNWQEFLCRPPVKQHSIKPSDIITTETGKDTDKIITINTITSVQDAKAIHDDNVSRDDTTVKQKKKKTLLSRLIHTLRKLFTCSCTKKRAAAAYDDKEY